MVRIKSKDIISDELLINLYIKNKMSCSDIAKEFKLERTTITKRVKQLNISRTLKEAQRVSKKEKRKDYTVDKKYFNKIDTENKAYCLGFILGDGNVYKSSKNGYKMTLKLQLKDKEHLENLKKEFEYTGPLYESEKRNSVTLQISDTDFCVNLINNGVVPNKSKIAKFPNIPIQLRSHFIRGLIDADGCIGISGKYKYLYALGTLDVVLGIKKEWDTLSDFVYLYRRKYSDNLYEVGVKRKQSISDILNYLNYKDSLCLKRKKEEASKLILP